MLLEAVFSSLIRMRIKQSDPWERKSFHAVVVCLCFEYLRGSIVKVSTLVGSKGQHSGKENL